MKDMLEIIKSRIKRSIDVKQSMIDDDRLLDKIYVVVSKIIETYKNGGKVFLCGNGGSAADAQHIAAELSGRFYYDRPPLYAEALHTNTSYITAVANDYSYDDIYARYIKAAGNSGDVLIGISTSGNSQNVINALKQANDKDMFTVAFTGANGGKMKNIANILINIPSLDTPRIQEAHILVGHIICELVEASLFPK